MYSWNNHSLIEIPENTFPSDMFQGKGVFETILVKDHTCFFLWADHIQRLSSGILFFGNKVSINFQSLLNTLSNRFQMENRHGYFRLNLIYLPENNSLFIRIFPFHWPEQPSRLYMDNQYYRGNSPHYQYKTLSRMEYIVFQQLAQKNFYDDFLFVDWHQHILETCLANIFFIRKDGVFETPEVKNKPLLNGVLRRFLLRSQDELGIKCIQKTISVHSLSDYSQAFITNGLRLIQPVSDIGDVTYTQYNVGWELLEKIKQMFILHGA